MAFDQQPRTATKSARRGALATWIATLPTSIIAFAGLYLVLFFVFPIGWSGVLSFALLLVILLTTPLLALRFGSAWVVGIHRTRPPGVNEQRIVQLVETLTKTAHVNRVDILVIDSDAINAALVGGPRHGWTLLLTSGSTACRYDEQEALVALALAGAGNGLTDTVRLVLAATAPNIALHRLLRACGTPRRCAFAGTLSAMAAVLGGYAIDQTIVGTIFFAGIILIGLAAFAVPALFIWMAALAGVQTIAASVLVAPLRTAADAGALALTRYPPPMRRLLVRARHDKTRPGLFPLGLGSIWSLPVGSQGNKEQALLQRIRHLDALDPQGAARSLGG